MGAIASQITSPEIVYLTVYSDADQRKHQSSAWLAFVRGIHRGSVNSQHKWPVTRKMFPLDDVIMEKTFFILNRPWYPYLAWAIIKYTKPSVSFYARQNETHTRPATSSRPDTSKYRHLVIVGLRRSIVHQWDNHPLQITSEQNIRSEIGEIVRN